MTIINILALTQFAEIRVERNQGVGCTQIERIINPPIYL
jgi:hypothetical protein